MSITTLFADEGSWVASTRRVYTAGERGALEDAAAQASRLTTLVATREAELESARETAHGEGVAQGRREGAAAIAAELGEALAGLRDEVATERREHRQALITLALGVVRRLVGDVAPPERLAALARVAAAELVDEPRLVLHVHPSRQDALGDALAPADGKAVAAERGARRTHPFDAVVADAELGVDDALIETPGGRIAIDLETQLGAVREQLSARPEILASFTGSAA